MFAFLVVVLGTLTVQASAQCPSGWEAGNWPGGDRYCYKCVDLSSLTRQARKDAVTFNHCKTYDARAYPASIHSREEDNFIRKYGNQVAIGLYVRPCAVWSRENFLWRDHTPVDYTNWHANQPNNNNGNERHVVSRLSHHTGWEDVCAVDGRDYKKLACKIDLDAVTDYETL